MKKGKYQTAARWKGKLVVFVLAAVALAAVSAGCFAIEAVYMGYIPLLLRGVPHAYSYFHVTGLHYLTVSCVLVPALSVIYFCIEGGRSRGRLVCMLLADAAAVADSRSVTAKNLRECAVKTCTS